MNKEGESLLMPVKAMCETECKADEIETRTLDFIISTNKIDRSFDTISPDGWSLDAYKRNPVVLWAHDASMVPPAKASEIGVVGGKLRAKTEFAPASNPAVGAFAEGLLQLYKGGFLNATSVGFMPIEYAYADDPQRKGGINFTKQELMEFSLVPVPANSEALLEGKAALGAEVIRPVFDCMVKMVARMGAVDALLELRHAMSKDDLKAAAELFLDVTKDEPPLPKAEADERTKEIARRAYMRRKRQLDVIRIKGNN